MSVLCGVNLNTVECEAPGAGDPKEFDSIRTHCFACGLPACKSCSKMQPYLGYGRRRICNDCVGEYQT